MKKEISALNIFRKILENLVHLFYCFFMANQTGLIILMIFLDRTKFSDEHKLIASLLIIIIGIIPIITIWNNITHEDINSWFDRKIGHKIANSKK